MANKRERKLTAAHLVAKSYPLYLAVRMGRYGSLINISDLKEREIGKEEIGGRTGHKTNCKNLS